MTHRTAASPGDDPHATELAILRHELSQPVTYLIGSLSFLRSCMEKAGGLPPGSTLDELLAATEQSAHQVASLVRRIGVESVADVQPLDLAEVVSSTLQMVESELSPHADLVREIRVRPMVNASRTRLRQVLLNLLTNAVTAIRQGARTRGSIIVRLGTGPDHYSVLEIEDDGIGIIPEHTSRIGELQFTTRPGVGHGFGVNVARGIVESYGGTLHLESGPERGAIARVLLPPFDRAARCA